MAAKIISQKRFAKLVASTGVLSQPPGALTRLSNLLFTQRGSLQVCDGSKAIATNSDIPQVNAISVFTSLTAGVFPDYLSLGYSTTPQLDDVTGFSASPGSGSANPAGSYAFAIAATLGGTHTNPGNISASFIAGVAFGTVNFSWTAVAGATGYTIYYVYKPPLQIYARYVSLVTVGVTTTASFTGVVPTSPVVSPQPTYNDTYEIQLYDTSVVGLGPLATYSITAGLFPFILPQPATLAPGAPGFNGEAAFPSFSPFGGISGVVCAIPQIIQFAGNAILVLGNGYAPQALVPGGDLAIPVTALANTFTAAYPSWQASVSWLTDSVVTDGSGHYYTATQGGVSGATAPTWNTAIGAQTADGTVLWTSGGPVVTPPAPRGAAHAVAYAGSLWLANTSPANTSDGVDGPACIKMSDSNNPNSWNPVNTAFIGRSDGTQITGMQPFTIAALGISPTGSLCVFKEFTTYQVIGVFGSSSFEIQPAQTNLGCIASRSIQFLPGFGVIRYSHMGFAIFDGINDRLISEDIRPYLFGGVDSEADITPIDPAFCYLSQSAQASAPPMYMCAMPLTGSNGQMTRLFCYDLVLKAWAIVDLPWAITALTSISVGEGYPLVLAAKADGTLQRMQSGDIAWDTNATDQSDVQWSFRTPDLFGEGGSQRMFFEQATIKGYGSAAMAQSILATLWLDGQNLGAQAVDIVPQGGSNLFEARVRLFRTGYRAHLDVSGNGGGATGVIDSIDWAISPKSTMARRVIS